MSTAGINIHTNFDNVKKAPEANGSNAVLKVRSNTDVGNLVTQIQQAKTDGKEIFIQTKSVAADGKDKFFRLKGSVDLSDITTVQQITGALTDIVEDKKLDLSHFRKITGLNIHLKTAKYETMKGPDPDKIVLAGEAKDIFDEISKSNFDCNYHVMVSDTDIAFKQEALKSIKILLSNPEGLKLIKALEASGEYMMIKPGPSSHYERNTKDIQFNPNNNAAVYDKDNHKISQPPFITLAHEMVHGLHHRMNEIKPHTDVSNFIDFEKMEEELTIFPLKQDVLDSIFTADITVLHMDENERREHNATVKSSYTIANLDTAKISEASVRLAFDLDIRLGHKGMNKIDLSDPNIKDAFKGVNDKIGEINGGNVNQKLTEAEQIVSDLKNLGDDKYIIAAKKLDLYLSDQFAQTIFNFKSPDKNATAGLHLKYINEALVKIDRQAEISDSGKTIYPSEKIPDIKSNARLSYARMSIDAGDMDNALSLIKDSLNLKSANPKLLKETFDLAGLFAAAGENDKAVEVLELLKGHAMTKEPVNQSKLELEISKIYKTAGNTEKELEHLLKAETEIETNGIQKLKESPMAINISGRIEEIVKAKVEPDIQKAVTNIENGNFNLAIEQLTAAEAKVTGNNSAKLNNTDFTKDLNSKLNDLRSFTKAIHDINGNVSRLEVISIQTTLNKALEAYPGNQKILTAMNTLEKKKEKLGLH